MTVYRTTNPATGEVLAEFELASDEEVQEIIVRSFAAYKRLRQQPLQVRTNVLRQAAGLYRERSEELANLLILEIGKPLTQARQEVERAAAIYEYYADHAAGFIADELLDVPQGDAIVRTEPIGPLLGVMPWNFPYYQAARFVAPNLALGNPIILKHARNCPQSALAIAQVLYDAGALADAYINAFVDARQVSDLIADPRVRGVSLTGSEKAGSAVGEVAGRHGKPYVLELGGSDPFIVLADANIDHALTEAVRGRIVNAGQSCTASKRFIVVDEVYDEFTQKFIAALTDIEPGDPREDSTLLGPLSSERAAIEVDEIVADAVAKGAVLHRGVEAVLGAAFYSPAVLIGVTPAMRAFDEEIFGPVAVVYRVPDSDAAVTLANSSPYGLSSSVFTEDRNLADAVARELEVGMVWVNSISRGTPNLPFGGVKQSGVGRELAKYGMDAFANKKLVRVLPHSETDALGALKPNRAGKSTKQIESNDMAKQKAG